MPDQLTAAVLRINELKAQVQILEEERKTLEAELLGTLEASNFDSIVIDGAGKVTVVRPTSLKIDDVGLASELTKSQWNRVSRRVLDEKLLEDAVAKGRIDIGLVSKHSTEQTRKPYLRITPAKE